jgi:hypothetical protein
MLLAATGSWVARRTSRTAWRQAWRTHHPLVALVGAVPVAGMFAYVLATPLRDDHLLLRLAADSGLSRMPWRIHERSGSRRLLTIGRPAGARRLEPTVTE